MNSLMQDSNVFSQGFIDKITEGGNHFANHLKFIFLQQENNTIFKGINIIFRR